MKNYLYITILILCLLVYLNGCNLNQYKTWFMFSSSCQSCHYLCASCVSGGIGDCNSCYDRYYLSSGYCKSCHSICATCNGEGLTHCITCSVGFLTQDKICKICKPNEYKETNGDVSFCAACDTSCQTCSGAQSNQCILCPFDRYKNRYNECKKCGRREFLDSHNENRQCAKCHKSCKTCIERSTNCLTCNLDKFITENNVCSPCHRSCKKCNGSTANDCTHCDEYKYLNDDSECAICPSTGHISFTDEETRHGNCQVCLENEYLVILIPEKQIGYCRQCDQHQFLTITDKSIKKGFCTECHENCKTCSGVLKTDCLDCIGTKYLSSNFECLPCENGYIQRKDTENEYNSCQECTKGEYLLIINEDNRGGRCIVCNVNCLECNESSNSCTKCRFHEYVTPLKRCEECSPECLECNGPSRFNCIKCIQRFYIHAEGFCSECNKLCYDCFGGQSNQCLSCHSSMYVSTSHVCESCDLIDNCEQCTGVTCGRCYIGYAIIEKKCIPCKFFKNCISCNGDICTRCNYGYRIHLNNLCLLCHVDHCSNCYSSLETCSICKNGFILENNTCKPCSQIERCVKCRLNNCAACEEGFHAKPRYCEACHDYNCSSCNEYSEVCEICKKGYSLNSFGTCVDCLSEDNCIGKDAREIFERAQKNAYMRGLKIQLEKEIGIK